MLRCHHHDSNLRNDTIDKLRGLASYPRPASIDIGNQSNSGLPFSPLLLLMIANYPHPLLHVSREIYEIWDQI